MGEELSLAEGSYTHVHNRDLYPGKEPVIDEECRHLPRAVRLLCGESEEFVGHTAATGNGNSSSKAPATDGGGRGGGGGSGDGYGRQQLQAGHLVLTPYRFVAAMEDQLCNVPLGLIESVTVQQPTELQLYLKDGRVVRLNCHSSLACQKWYVRLLDATKPYKTLREAFAFAFRAHYRDCDRLSSEKSSHSHSSHPHQQREHRELVPPKHTPTVTTITSSSPSPSPSPSSPSPSTFPFTSTPAHASSSHANFSFEGAHNKTSEWLNSEWKRLGMGGPVGVREGKEQAVSCQGPWRIAECNTRYQLCATYPKLLLVPSSISDDELVEVASFRMNSRIPTVVWRHKENGCVIARSSQPLVSFLGWRNKTDEKLLQAISDSCVVSSSTKPTSTLVHSSALPSSNGQCNGAALVDSNGTAAINGEPAHCRGVVTAGNKGPKLVVLDLRSYTAALGNRMKGGGCECEEYYPNCEIQYKGLANIHSVRKSFQSLRTLLASDEQNNFFSSLESTQWLYHLSQLLSAAQCVVSEVCKRKRPVLVHCSDGWDRTTQVVSLAELLLDPYYRTIKGFQILIEREWVAFGHKFGQRLGHLSDDLNQRSPVFLQWLDCVHQLLRQFPCDFQFSETFLIKLGQHSFSCLFGTFLGNSSKEKEELRVAEETFSVWSLLNLHNSDCVNYLYVEGAKVLYPVTNTRNVLLWKGMYCGSSFVPYDHASSPRDHAPSLLEHSLPRSDSTDTQPQFSASTGDTFLPRHSANEGGIPVPAVAIPRTEEGRDSESESSFRTIPSPSHQNSDSTGVEVSDSTATLRESLLLHRSSSSGDHLGMESTESPFPPSEEPAFAINTTAPGSSPTGSPSKRGGGPTTTSLSSTPDSSNSNGCFQTVELQVPNDDDDEEDEECLQGPPAVVSLGLMGGESELGGGEGRGEGEGEGGLLEGAGEGRLVEGDGGNGELLRGEGEPLGGDGRGLEGSASEGGGGDHLVVHAPDNANGVAATLAAMPKPGSGGNDATTALTRGGLTTVVAPLQEVGGFDPSPFWGFSVPLMAPFGEDGLPRIKDKLQCRVKQLIEKHRRELASLQEELKRTHVIGKGPMLPDRETDEDVSKGLVACSPEDESSSMNSWDCVDSEEQGTRWVPDHAAIHCTACGSAFWAMRRRHHCRSCGKVFCSSCTSYSCPVEHEQLADPVRVCEKCFYKLDGHLKTNNH